MGDNWVLEISYELADSFSNALGTEIGVFSNPLALTSNDDKSTITANYNVTGMINDVNDIRAALSNDLSIDKKMWDANKKILDDADKVAILA